MTLHAPASTSAPAAGTPGVPAFADGELISTSPATGDEVGRFPVADADAVGGRGDAGPRRAGAGGAASASTGASERLLRVARRDRQAAGRARSTSCTPRAASPGPTRSSRSPPALDHMAWSARNAKRVLRSRRVGGNLLLAEFSARLEYQPFGVIGVIGPWNYPILTPIGSIAYALAAGNAVVFKPSEYTPAVGAVVRRPLRRGRARAPGAADRATARGETGAAPGPRGRGQGRLHRLPRHRPQDHGGLRRDADPGAASRAAARTR